MKKKIWIVAVVFLISFTFQMQISAQSKNSGTNNKKPGGKNKPVWKLTDSQKELPPIVIIDDGREREFSFESLIKADGYLCPGSARSYKTLLTALPILFGNSIPKIEDFKIMYGPSDCSTRVYEYLMSGADQLEEHLVLDELMLGREHIVTRISTGESVKIIYDLPAADGHNKDGAEAGDLVLYAEDGVGMEVTLLSSNS